MEFDVSNATLSFFWFRFISTKTFLVAYPHVAADLGLDRRSKPSLVTDWIGRPLVVS